MEDVLDTYCLPYDADIPLVCMDEQPRQLVKETRVEVSNKPGRPKRIDYEYERNGTTNIFMFTEPLGGRRYANVVTRKTSEDWACQIRELLEARYPDAEKIRLVCDNLKTHGIGSLYKTFAPEKARELARRLEIHYTPKHGSWLNIAEIELSALTRQCLDRRIPDEVSLKKEVAAWENNRNKLQKGVDWQFKTNAARIKLKRLYPTIQS